LKKGERHKIRLESKAKRKEQQKEQKVLKFIECQYRFQQVEIRGVEGKDYIYKQENTKQDRFGQRKLNFYAHSNPNSS
jgi:phosphomevalonate kinase